jgi:uncharacterized protein (DUF488 family)
MAGGPLYTIGYQGWRPDDLVARVRALGATLADIRMRPTSPNPAWRRAALQARLGDRYTWLGALGNVNYRTHAQGSAIVLADSEAGMAVLGELLAAGPVAIMCGCRDWRTCHRAFVARLAADAFSVPIIHLEAARHERQYQIAQDESSTESHAEGVADG